jgi:hypothetical protein
MIDCVKTKENFDFDQNTDERENQKTRRRDALKRAEYWQTRAGERASARTLHLIESASRCSFDSV